MAFVLQPKTDGFFYPILLPVVTDSGASQIQKFEFKFRRVSRSRMTELQKAQERMNDADTQADTLERDTDYVMEVAEGWRSVNGADDRPMDFSRDNVYLLLDNYPNAASVIVGAFLEATLGGGGKRKN